MIYYFAYDRKISKFKDRYSTAYNLGLETISDWISAGPTSDTLTPSRQALADKCQELTSIPYWNFLHCGSDALQISISMFSQPGDKVIVPAWTHMAVPQSPCWINRQLVFCDVGTDGLLCPNSLKKAISDHPDAKVVIPVHFLGRVCDMKEIKNTAQNLKIIEDAANSFYFPDDDCDLPGLYSDSYCCSFDMAKSPGGTGTGGAIASLHQDVIVNSKVLSQQGISRDRSALVEFGRKSSMDDTTARVILEDINILIEYNFRNIRQQNHDLFSREIHKEQLTGKNYGCFGFALFPDKMSGKEARAFFKANGIATHGTTVYACFPETDLFKNSYSSGHRYASRLSKECIVLPVHEYLTEDEKSLIIEVANKI